MTDIFYNNLRFSMVTYVSPRRFPVTKVGVVSVMSCFVSHKFIFILTICSVDQPGGPGPGLRPGGQEGVGGDGGVVGDLPGLAVPRVLEVLEVVILLPAVTVAVVIVLHVLRLKLVEDPRISED